ncbi:MAG: type I restriction endonuclease, partial [Kiritimatiellia bacterium]
MKPGEHKTVQARILAYAQEIGWTFVSREQAEKKRSADTPVRLQHGEGNADRSVRAPVSLFFLDLLEAKVREFNPRYAEAEGVLVGKLELLHADIFGNRAFVEFLRNRGTFFDQEEGRERDLMLIDYEDPSRNVYEVTEEWVFENGRYGTREDVVFLINGIPVLVIECKNANKDEAIALGVDQIRRYHRETPELFVPEQVFAATDAIGFSYGVTWNTVRRNIFNWKTERGHSCPPTPYLDRNQPILKYKHVLPHWKQEGKWMFVTWRLGDSLPESRLRVWREERKQWLSEHPEPWDEETEDLYHRTFTDRIETWLDQGHGACVLSELENAQHVADVLLFDNGRRVELDCFSVMPNHVHVLFRLLPGESLDKVLQSWKGISSRRINQHIGKSGTLWQADYWDRLIRSEKHFWKVRNYILENPAKAGLTEGFLLWDGKEVGGQECPRSVSSCREEEEVGGQECPRSVSFSGKLEARIKSFCAIPQVLAFLKDYIVFAEKDEELNKYILRQHQTGA